MSEQKQNQWRHGRTRFEVPALDDYMGMGDGFLPLPVVLDSEVGEEVVLFVSGQQENFFEFENHYGLAEALDFFDEACRNITTIEFDRAKQRFMEEHSIGDLFATE